MGWGWLCYTKNREICGKFSTDPRFLSTFRPEKEAAAKLPFCNGPGAAFFSPRCFRHWRRFGEKLVARRIDDHPFGWCFYFGNGDVPFVGADAPAARNHAGNEATPLVAEGHDFVRRGGGPYGVGRYRVLCNRPRRWASTGSRRAEVFAPCGGKRFRLPFTVPRCPIAPSSVTARWAVPPSPQGEGGA